MLSSLDSGYVAFLLPQLWVTCKFSLPKKELMTLLMNSLYRSLTAFDTSSLAWNNVYLNRFKALIQISQCLCNVFFDLGKDIMQLVSLITSITKQTYNVIVPCSSWATATAMSVPKTPSIPCCFSESHPNKTFNTTQTMLWYSMAHAPGYLICVFLRVLKSANKSQSEQWSDVILTCSPAFTHNRTQNEHSSSSVRENKMPGMSYLSHKAYISCVGEQGLCPVYGRKGHI